MKYSICKKCLFRCRHAGVILNANFTEFDQSEFAIRDLRSVRMITLER